MKKCEICGKEKPENEFSKAYKHRCKQCVAEQEKQKRHAKKSNERKAVDKLLERNESSLYNNEWVQKAAEDGYKNFLKAANNANPNVAKHIEHNNFWFELLYYSAFEAALNTFIQQVLEDTKCNVELYLDELHKITATIDIQNSTK